MAYVDQPGQTEQDKLNQQSPLNQPPTTGTAIGSAGAGDKTPNQPSSSVAPAPFTNLGSYLQVNAPQLQGMAEKVSGQLGQTYDTAKGAVDTGAQAIQNQITGGYAAPNQAIVEQAAANPAEFASTPENVAAFQAQYGNKYTGPASAEVTPDYTTTQGTVQKAVNDAANLGNYGGLQSYLTTNLETNPTQAMSALDTALLNQSPEAISQINTAAQRFPDLNNYFAQALAQQNQNIAGAQKTAADTAAATQQKFKGEVIPGFQSALDQQLQAAKTAAENKKYLDMIEATKPMANLKEELQSDIGFLYDPTNLTRSYYPAFRNFNPLASELGYADLVNPNDYSTFQNPDVQFTRENVANQADYAKAAALKQLIGGDYTGLNPADLAQAGTAPKSLLDFNKPSYEKDVQDRLRAADENYLKTWSKARAYDKGPFEAPTDYKITREDFNATELPKIREWEKSADPNVQAYAKEALDRFERLGYYHQRLQTGKEGMQWWDGDKWVAAPDEFQYQDKDGNPAGPGDATKVLKFNYDTGKYEDTGYTGGGDNIPGVLKPF